MLNLCKSKNKRSSVKVANDSVYTEKFKYVPFEDFGSKSQETCGVIKAWRENGQSDDDDYSVLSVRTFLDQNGLETKKVSNVRLGWKMIKNLNIPVDSVSPMSF